MKITNVEIERHSNKEAEWFHVKVKGWEFHGSYPDASEATEKTWEHMQVSTLEEALSFVHEIKKRLAEA